MKTKEEVKKHVESCGYSKRAVDKICGFLIAKDLKDVDEHFRFLKGNLTFEDFLVWFTVDFDSLTMDVLEIGDAVHVAKGSNVIILNIMDGSREFVGFDGTSVGCYVLGKDSRMCNTDEIRNIADVMHENCLDFDFSEGQIIPSGWMSDEEED